MLHVFKEFYISWLWRAAASSQSATKPVSVFRQGRTKIFILKSVDPSKAEVEGVLY